MGRLWRGEMPLPDAFWIWAVAVGFAVNATSLVASYLLLAADEPFWALIAGHTFSVFYNLIALVGVLRSCRRADADPALAWLACIVTIPAMIILSIA